MSIFETQAIYDAVTTVLLALRPDARQRTRAFVEVSTGEQTKAALMERVAGDWQITTIYTADHYVPGTVGVVVRGVW